MIQTCPSKIDELIRIVRYMFEGSIKSGRENRAIVENELLCI